MSSFRVWQISGVGGLLASHDQTAARPICTAEPMPFGQEIGNALNEIVEAAMHELIYLVGLVVVVMFILSRLGLH